MPKSSATRSDGREAGELAAPVADHARRRDDQRRQLGARFALVAEVRDRLQRLAEAHVVGEQAAGGVGAQAREPCDALLLIRAQGRLQPRRGRDQLGQLGRGRIEERACARAQREVGVDAQRAVGAREDLVELDERGGARAGEAGIAVGRALIELGEHARERAELIGRQLDVAALLGDLHEARPLAIEPREVEAAAVVFEHVEQHRQQIDAVAAHVDAELEAEPVGLVARA